MNAKLLIGSLAFLAIAVPAAAVGGGMIADDPPELPIVDPFLDDVSFDATLTWDILVGGPEGDHAALDDEGSLHMTECTLDAEDDLDVGGEEGTENAFLQDTEEHVDVCETSQG